MYCPSCSIQAVDGAKFCKACGLNLGVITQALNGGVIAVSDPLRDREYKRARKQISDGIQGTAIGAGLLVTATLGYFIIPKASYVYVLCLGLALTGTIKLFRSVGGIIDAKVGPKLLDPALQPRGTGGLNSAQPATAAASNVRPSQRLVNDLNRGAASSIPSTRPVSIESDLGARLPAADAPVESSPRAVTGRVNREHSSPLRRLDKDDDLMSKLRN